jgi:hypothetical protein
MCRTEETTAGPARKLLLNQQGALPSTRQVALGAITSHFRSKSISQTSVLPSATTRAHTVSYQRYVMQFLATQKKAATTRSKLSRVRFVKKSLI